MGRQTHHGVTKLVDSGSDLERRAVVGKSPVREIQPVSARVSQVTPDPGKPA